MDMPTNYYTAWLRGYRVTVCRLNVRKSRPRYQSLAGIVESYVLFEAYEPTQPPAQFKLLVVFSFIIRRYGIEPDTPLRRFSKRFTPGQFRLDASSYRGTITHITWHTISPQK